MKRFILALAFALTASTASADMLSKDERGFVI